MGEGKDVNWERVSGLEWVKVFQERLGGKKKPLQLIEKQCERVQQEQGIVWRRL